MQKLTNEQQAVLKELQEQVNNLLTNTFKEDKLAEGSPLWSILLNLVPSNAKDADIPLIIACNYILLTYQGASNLEGNKETIRIGSISYDGSGKTIAKVNQANNLLAVLGFSNCNFGVVNG